MKYLHVSLEIGLTNSEVSQYRIKAEHVTEVAEYLDIREINGYTIHYTPFYPADGSAPTRTLVYIGTPDNDQFVGPQDPQVSNPRVPPFRLTPTREFLLPLLSPTPKIRFCSLWTTLTDSVCVKQALAEHIQRSEGPSGLNRDYLLELEKALGELSPESGDTHVTDLSDRLREIERKIKSGDAKVNVKGGPLHVSHEFAKASSVDEQEETEKA